MVEGVSRNGGSLASTRVLVTEELPTGKLWTTRVPVTAYGKQGEVLMTLGKGSYVQIRGKIGVSKEAGFFVSARNVLHFRIPSDVAEIPARVGRDVGEDWE